jgi:hypothetical protein
MVLLVGYIPAFLLPRQGLARDEEFPEAVGDWWDSGLFHNGILMINDNNLQSNRIPARKQTWQAEIHLCS